MKKFNKYLYDNLDREYERKNLYLYEVATLQEKVCDAEEAEKRQLKAKLDDLVKNKSQHYYNIKLVEYKKKEKDFTAELSNKSKEFSEKIEKDLPKEIIKLKVRLFEAEKKRDFYGDYIDLTYEAELIYEQSKIEVEQIPQIVKVGVEDYRELTKALKRKSEIDKVKEENFKREFTAYKIEEKKKLEKEINEIKKKYNEGLISTKAKEQGIKQAKRKLKEKILVKSFESEKNNNEEIIKNKKYELGKGLKQKINTLNVNAADLRRIYPIEMETTTTWKGYATFLIPGLGQLLNNQYAKSIIMFLATIYIYLIAIPYAIGFGNYMGTGVSGLLTLAEGGGRLDRSIIFMIEGLIAIFLLVIAFVLLLISFKDVNKVEKERIKGTREKNWIETRQSFLEDGFPYIVSTPALIITIFIVFVPIATTILLSFTGMDPDHQAKFGWIGIDNYKMMILGQGLAGSIFWKILGWTLIWTLVGTSISILLGFTLAIVLNNERIKGKTLFRSIYLLPWAVPAFITITFFSILSSPDGTLSNLLSDIFGKSISIKNDAFIARSTLICMQAWLGSAYVFLLSTGVLQSISGDLYEAADIDGASNFKKLTKITIPMVLFQTAPLLVGQYTFNFNNFSIIYLFNGGGPFNPTEYGNLAGETDLLISYIYKLTMENKYQALGATITVVISVALMIIAYIGYRNTNAFKKEK